MYKYINGIRSSWTYKHPREIIIITLVVVVLFQAYEPLEQVKKALASEPVIYSKQCATIDCIIEERALAIFERDRATNLEQSRLEVIRELNSELIEKTAVSPFVDYEQLKSKYGY
jgi:hypothetical protein